MRAGSEADTAACRSCSSNAPCHCLKGEHCVSCDMRRDPYLCSSLHTCADGRRMADARSLQQVKVWGVMGALWRGHL